MSNNTYFLFNLPHASRPGTDRMCKAVVSNPKVVDIISSALLNAEAGIYRLDNTEWFNGTRSDLVLIPPTFDNDHRPIIIEFQRVVDSKFMKRALNYCLQAANRYMVDPILLIVCIDYTTGSPKDLLQTSERLPCCKKLPCEFWASECFLLSKESIQEFITVEAPLNPLVALGMFLTYQATSITLLPRNDDPTVIFLYEVAKEIYQVMYDKDLALLEHLKDVCDVQSQQYQKMLDILQNDQQPLDTIVHHVQEGINHANLMKRNYDEINTNETSETSITTTANPIDAYKEGMVFVDEFRKQRDEEGKRMDWKLCLSDGKKKGLLFGYKNIDSLRSQFTKYQKTMKKEKRNN